MEAHPQVIVTPFDPNSYSSEVIAHDSINSTPRTEQQPLIAAEDPEGEMVALHRLSSVPTPPDLIPRSRPAEPIPAGLTDNDLARLRAEARSSPPQSHNLSTPDVSQSTFSSGNAVTESGEATSAYDPRRLHSEVESLRREMERLRTEGIIIEAPPSYTEGDR